MNQITAIALYSEAQEWPRCGEDWPCGSKEEEAQAIRDALMLDEQGRTPEEVKECEAEWAAQAARIVKAKAVEAEAAEALVVRALANARGDVKIFIRAFPAGASASDICRFDPSGNIVRGFRVKGIKTNKKGNYIC